MTRKITALLLLLYVIASPSYALNLLDRIRYKEVRLGNEKVLVNNITGKVEKKLIDNKYEPISAEKGFKGIISEQEMYQAQYDRKKICRASGPWKTCRKGKK
jgi:hypothetical protein